MNSLNFALCAAVMAAVLSASAQTGFVAVDAGPNHRIWQKVERYTVGDATYARTNEFTEIASGLNAWSENQQRWVEADDEIELFEGAAAARKSQHSVIFSADAADPKGTVDLLMLDGGRLRTQVLGVAYVDAQTGASALIAELKSSTGFVFGRNEVIYADALDGTSADLRYLSQRDRFEADVIFRERLIDPAALGMNPATVNVEVWTRILEQPQIQQQERVLHWRDGQQAADVVADLGTMQIVSGKAFSLEAADGAEYSATPVAKSISEVEGVTFIIESVPYSQLKPLLDVLPAPDGAKIEGIDPARFMAESGNGGSRRLPPRLLASSGDSTGPRHAPNALMVKAELRPRPGVVWDWVAVTTTTNMTFEGPNTYKVSGTVNLSGTTTIEGGAVVKFATSASAQINILGALSCKTAPYRPAVFTSEYDSTIGEAVSTGTPATYGGIALNFDSSTSGVAYDLSNVRFHWAATAVKFSGQHTHYLRHAQFVNCGTAVNGSVTAVVLRNILIDAAGDAILNGYSTGLTIENMTIHNSTRLYNDSGWFGSTPVLYNCLIVAVGTVNSYSGSNNSQLSSASGVFDVVGAGSFYLAPFSPYRNSGTTGVNILSDLKKRTTFPPLVLSTSVEIATTLFPQAQRDDDGAPDKGYHYDAIDYAVNTLPVEGTVLTLARGTVVAAYGHNGLWLKAGSTLNARGSALNPVRLVRFSNVQEQALNWGGAAGSPVLLNPYNTGADPSVDLRFTVLDLMSGGGYHCYSLFSSDWAFGSVYLKDCEVANGILELQAGSGGAVSFHNTLLRRVGASLQFDLDVNVYNTLFWGGSLDAFRTASTAWTVKDSVFHNAAISEWATNTFTHANNGYLGTGQVQLSGTTSSNIVNSSFTYVTRTLGDFYQSSTSLQDKGSRTANTAGLYHYTTRRTNGTADTKEGTTAVDIGYHYVALTASGFPVDTDGDGLADVEEDLNGSGGDPDPGETDWEQSENGTTSVADLVVFTPLE